MVIFIEPFSYRREIYRKLIHLSSLWMPVLMLQASRAWALGLFTAALAAVLLFEILRRRSTTLARAFGSVIRPQELKSATLTGAPYVLLAAILLSLLFPPVIAAAALAVALLGDSAAALVGRLYGRTRIGNKSLEGSVAFVAAGLLAVACVALAAGQPSGFILIGALASCAAAVTELYARRLVLDDNLTVPLAAALVMWFFLR